MASVASAMGGRHPVDPSKPLIDYATALMLTPVLLLGTSIGMPPDAAKLRHTQLLQHPAHERAFAWLQCARL